jgi:hypothetical protein
VGGKGVTEVNQAEPVRRGSRVAWSVPDSLLIREYQGSLPQFVERAATSPSIVHGSERL